MRIVVATDDRRILATAAAAGVEAVLTDPRHRSGTERVAEVVALPAYAGTDIVLNLQGDEPFIASEAVHGALGRVHAGDPIGTAAARLPAEKAGDGNRVKVTLDRNGHALAFSRAPVLARLDEGPGYLQHLGVYAYTRQALLEWVAGPPVAAEQAERLEQLRPLSHGVQIGVAVIAEEARPGIDTEDDVACAEAFLRGREVTA